MKDAETRTALKISLFYLFAVELWDILSDIALTGPIYHLESLTLPFILKDMVFTFSSAVFIFGILRHELRRLKAMETILRESEERFRSIYEHSMDAIFLTKPDRSILAANPAACRILGRTEQEICEVGQAGIVDFSDPNATAALEERQKTGQFFHDVSLIHKNGARVPMEMTSSIFTDKDGNQRTSMIARDVSRRKRVERALQENQTRLQMLLEKIPALLWTTDTDLRYTSLVGAALASIGVRPDQSLGKQVGTAAPSGGNAINLVREQHQRVLLGGTASFDIEWSGRYFHNEIEPLYDDNQQIIGCIGVALDITDRVKAYQLLEHRVEERTREIDRRREVAEGLREIVRILNSNHPLEEILNFIVSQANHVLRANSIALYLLNQDKNILCVQATTGWDAHLQKELGYSPDSGSIGRAMTTQRPVVINDIQQALLRGDLTLEPQLLDLMRDNGFSYQCEVVVPLVVNGESYGVIRLTYFDHHDLTTEETELAVALSDQASLAIGNSYLRNQAEMLAVINERNRLARELHDSVTQSLYSLTLMAEASRRMADAGDYDLAKSYLGRLGQTAQQSLKEMRLLVYQLRPHVLELEGLVGALQQRLDAVESRAGVETHLYVDGPVELGSSIEEELYRISQEALNNSLKHSKASSVTISIHSAGEMIELSVADNGIGFDLGNPKDTGGMGLINMRERAEHLGGQFRVQSSPGSGTIVKVSARMH